jgi:hypothetical protein
MKHEPAFPTKTYNRNIMQFEDREGMTLRDYFAAKAMQGIVSKEKSHVSWVDEYAKNAYKMADAMLKAREA